MGCLRGNEFLSGVPKLAEKKIVCVCVFFPAFIRSHVFILIFRFNGYLKKNNRNI